jgi:hypothetical protein
MRVSKTGQKEAGLLRSRNLKDGYTQTYSLSHCEIHPFPHFISVSSLIN